MQLQSPVTSLLYCYGSGLAWEIFGDLGVDPWEGWDFWERGTSAGYRVDRSLATSEGSGLNGRSREAHPTCSGW